MMIESSVLLVAFCDIFRLVEQIKNQTNETFMAVWHLPNCLPQVVPKVIDGVKKRCYRKKLFGRLNSRCGAERQMDRNQENRETRDVR